MENRKAILLTLCCVLLLLSTLYLLNQNQKVKQVQSTLSDLIVDLQIKENFFQTHFNTASIMNGLYAPDISYLKNFHEKKLSDLVQDKPIFICVYKMECSSCEKNELNEIQDIFKDNIDKAYILCSHIIERQLYIYAKEQQIKVPILGIASNSFDWMVESHNKPYYFVLHPNMQVSHVYIPSKEYPEFNKQYLEGVKRLFFD